MGQNVVDFCLLTTNSIDICFNKRIYRYYQFKSDAYHTIQKFLQVLIIRINFKPFPTNFVILKCLVQLAFDLTFRFGNHVKPN